AEIGDVQVRNCGTIGGSLAHADPSGDWPAAMLAVEAEMTLVARKGTRTVAAKAFFVDILTSALEPGEILTEIRFAADREPSGSAYRKLHQPASGYALVGVAMRVALGEGKRCRQARVGITGVGSKAYRARGVEQALENQSVSAKLIAQAAGKAAAGVEARSDLHGSAEYRAAMAEVFTRRALTAAFERARHGG
ncbi:MAG: FAD binding domain-containing protein, partial [Terriglobia bacterium]